jgi:hypothetical protein
MEKCLFRAFFPLGNSPRRPRGSSKLAVVRFGQPCPEIILPQLPLVQIPLRPLPGKYVKIRNLGSVSFMNHSTESALSRLAAENAKSGENAPLRPDAP